MALGYQKHLSLRTLKKAIILVYRNSLQPLSVKIGRETKYTTGGLPWKFIYSKAQQLNTIAISKTAATAVCQAR